MDGNLESLLHRRARQWSAAPRVCQVDFGLTVPGDLDPQIARQRKQGDLMVRRVDRDHDHGLRQEGVLRELLVVVAPQEKDVDPLLGVQRGRGMGRRWHTAPRGSIVIAKQLEHRQEIQQPASDQGETDHDGGDDQPLGARRPGRARHTGNTRLIHAS